MSLDRVDFPNAAPVAISDWEKIIDIAEYNSLGDQNWWDFSGDTIKQGVKMMIGGSVYLATTATAITGTPSDYVKITPTGATASAAYVSSLAGVTWNSVWNFYEDGSGNAYLFDHAKAGVHDSSIGKFSENAYFKHVNINASSGGSALIVNESEDDVVGFVLTNTATTAGFNYGMKVSAGSSDADYALSVNDKTDSPIIRVRGDKKTIFYDNVLIRQSILTGYGLTVGSSGALIKQEVNDNLTMVLENTAPSTGFSYGLKIKAGTNATDYALSVNDKSDSAIIRVRGDKVTEFTGPIFPRSGSVEGSWSLTTTPIIIPRGIYSVYHQAGTQIEMQWNSSWYPISRYQSASPGDDLGDLIFSDGVNFRASASGTATMLWRKF